MRIWGIISPQNENPKLEKMSMCHSWRWGFLSHLTQRGIDRSTCRPSWNCTAACMASSSLSTLSFQVLLRFSHAEFTWKNHTSSFYNIIHTQAMKIETSSNSKWLRWTISITSSILFFITGLSGSPQAVMSSAPWFWTASSSSCSPSISSLNPCSIKDQQSLKQRTCCS